MDKFKRWALRGLMGVATLAAVLALTVFVASEFYLGKKFAVAESQFSVPEGAEQDAEIIAEGERLARIRGCVDACHGPGGEGQLFAGGIIAPNLPRLAREYNDTELEATIRQGIRPDGTTTFLMPSEVYQYLSDEDLADIIVFFRSLPESSNDLGPRSFPLMIRAFISYFGIIKQEQIRSVEKIAATDFTVHSGPEVRDDPVAFGRYLAMSICVKCHGAALHGGMGNPDLIVASGYSEAEFRHLLATGETMDDRDLGGMAKISRRRFSHLHPEEADAIYAWLTSDAFMMEERE